jgi:hypothetical protein
MRWVIRGITIIGTYIGNRWGSGGMIEGGLRVCRVGGFALDHTGRDSLSVNLGSVHKEGGLFCFGFVFKINDTHA